MAAPVNNSAWLQWMTTLMGGVSRQNYAATFPPDRFYCLLDDLPLHLVPRWSRTPFRLRNDQPLLMNPECLIRDADELPDEVSSPQNLAGFALQGAIAWVREAGSRNLLPFWLGPELADKLHGLKAGEAVPSTLGNHERALLHGSGILINEDDAAARSQETERIDAAAHLFQTKGYAPLRGLIHPFHVAALRRYYRYLIRAGAIPLGDGQSPLRYAAYNEPVARFFHRHLAKKISALAGESLQPSYVYLASYLSGAELKKHTDRKQCEFSVTLCLDFSPEPELASPWPIQLDPPTGTVKVYQALGDGLAYRGTRLPHYRDVLGKGQTSTSIFFHYVSADFAGSLG
ncbi:MAG TPA: hypothetical protein VMR80_08910 [Candidatus Acidoferrum sp.]|nr:hypothetical protein [Candidatus Acidoferrum sp.]